MRPWCDPDLAEHSAAGRGHHVESLRTREVLCCTNLDNKKIRFAGILEPSSGLEPETSSLPSSNEEGSAGKGGKPRARKPRKKKESPEDE